MRDPPAKTQLLPQCLQAYPPHFDVKQVSRGRGRRIRHVLEDAVSARSVTEAQGRPTVPEQAITTGRCFFIRLLSQDHSGRSLEGPAQGYFPGITRSGGAGKPSIAASGKNGGLRAGVFPRETAPASYWSFPREADRSKVAVSPGSAWSKEGRIVPRTVAFLNKKGGVGKTSTCTTSPARWPAGASGAPDRRRPAGQPDPGAARARRRRGPRPPGDDRRRLRRRRRSGPRRPGPRRPPSPTSRSWPGSEAAERFNHPDPWDCGLAPVRAPRRPGRGRRRLRPRADRLPPEHPALGLGGAGRRRRRRRPAPGRGLRRPGPQGDPAIDRPRAGRGRTPGSPCSATWSPCTTRRSRSTSPTRATSGSSTATTSSPRSSRWRRTSRRP